MNNSAPVSPRRKTVGCTGCRALPPQKRSISVTWKKETVMEVAIARASPSARNMPERPASTFGEFATTNPSNSTNPSSAAMKSRKPVNRVSKEQSRRKRLYAVIAKTFKLEHPLCECCQVINPAWKRQWSTDVHHTHGKIGDLLFYVPWFKAACRDCHQWIDANRAEARELGLLCPRGEWNVQPPSICCHGKLLTAPCKECSVTAVTI